MNFYTTIRVPGLTLKLVKTGINTLNMQHAYRPVCSVLRISFPGYANHIKEFSLNHAKVLLQAEGMAAKIERNSKDSKIGDVEIKKDSEGRLIVYDGVLKTQIRSVKLFSLATTFMGLTLQPVLLSKTVESAVVAKIALFGIVGFFTFVTPLLIHSLAKKYVTEILYAPETDTYTAVTFNFFSIKKETQFKIEDVIVPDVPGPFTNLLIKVRNDGVEKKMPLFIAPNTFLDITHYGRLMGYDKPIDLHLNSEVEELVKRKEKQSK